MVIRLDRHLPLSQRILCYYAWLREPCHYSTVAAVLHRPAEKVQVTCAHLAKAGRLRRVGVGVYALSEAREEEEEVVGSRL